MADPSPAGPGDAPRGDRFFRALIEHASDLITVLDAEGVIRYASPSSVRVLGHAPADLVGRRVLDLIHPDDAELALATLQAGLTGTGPIQISVHRMSHADGSWRWLGGVGSNRLDDPELRGIVVNLRDVTERVQAQAALQETHEMLRALVAAAPDAVIAVDVAGRITLWNPGAERIFGWREAEVLGRPIPTVPPEGQAEHDRLLRRVLGGEAFSNVEVRRTRRNGTRIPVRVSTAPMRDGAGRVIGVISVSVDISAQKRAEDALQRKEEYFRTITENSSDVVTILTTEGTVLYQSPSITRILGYAQDELLGTDALDAVHPADRARVGAELEALQLERHAVRSVVYRYRRKDGVWRVLESFGMNLLHNEQVAGVVVNTRDVTERVEAEEANRRLAAIVQASSDAIVSRLLDDGAIVSWNPGAERLYGYSAEEVLGCSAASLIIPPELREAERSLWQRLTQGETIEHHETLRMRRDGSVFPVSLSAAPIRDETGRVYAAAVIARDISEQKRTERELRQAKEAAEAASRAKSEFLSSMSHELRTPLNSVIGFANVLHRNKAGNLRPQELAYVERIVASGRHLLGLINDLLDLSKIEAGKMEVERAPLDLRALLEETLDELQPQRGANVRLRLEIPGTAALIETDARKLKQILINLVGNALKFTMEGSVTIAVRVDERTHRPTQVDVIDTGIGIPGEQLARIFEAFEQGEQGTARRFGGTGLGLAISASLARLLGYRIEVESREGEGSTFRVLLTPPPLAPEQPLQRLSGAERGEFGGKRVLVIDDDTDSRVVLAEALAEAGCEVLAAASGEQGLRAAHDFAPDLITLDLVMPGLSGWETLRALKADPALDDVPVVIVSVAADEEHGALVGAVDLLSKPLERSTLRHVLRRNLRGRHTRVLVVDDEEDVRLLVASALREEGVEIRTASNGREALRVARSFAPDLVFLDLLMPDQDGLAFLAELRRELPHLQPTVVVVTGKELSGPQLHAVHDETPHLIRKGSGLEEELRRVVRDLLER